MSVTHEHDHGQRKRNYHSQLAASFGLRQFTRFIKSSCNSKRAFVSLCHVKKNSGDQVLEILSLPPRLVQVEANTLTERKFHKRRCSSRANNTNLLSLSLLQNVLQLWNKRCNGCCQVDVWWWQCWWWWWWWRLLCYKWLMLQSLQPIIIIMIWIKQCVMCDITSGLICMSCGVFCYNSWSLKTCSDGWFNSTLSPKPLLQQKFQKPRGIPGSGKKKFHLQWLKSLNAHLLHCRDELHDWSTRHDISCNFSQHPHIKSSLSLWDTQKQNCAKAGKKKSKPKKPRAESIQVAFAQRTSHQHWQTCEVNQSAHDSCKRCAQPKIRWKSLGKKKLCCPNCNPSPKP